MVIPSYNAFPNIRPRNSKRILLSDPCAALEEGLGYRQLLCPESSKQVLKSVSFHNSPECNLKF